MNVTGRWSLAQAFFTVVVPECVDETVADGHEVEEGRLSPVLRRDLRDPKGHDGRQQEQGVVAWKTEKILRGRS